MQKVEGSSPFIRFREPPETGVFCWPKRPGSDTLQPLLQPDEPKGGEPQYRIHTTPATTRHESSNPRAELR
jgi:hypothetical protein